ncbi:hypothetical protein K439DRAFT_1622449 [Ramaria rubella]|nr:hypothetical protein K439DRAFT_1622449 [Ramaria rubella]
MPSCWANRKSKQLQSHFDFLAILRFLKQAIKTTVEMVIVISPNLSLDGRGGRPPHLQAHTDVPLMGPPAPSTPLPASAHIAEDNPMEVDPADSLDYDNSVEVAAQSSSTAPAPIYADPPSAYNCPNLPEVWSVGRM